MHFDVFLLVVEATRKDLTTLVNHQILRPMLDLNYPGLEDYPRWSFLPITDDLRMELLKGWTTLVETGVVTPQNEDEKHVRKMMQFPERRPEPDRRRAGWSPQRREAQAR